MKPIINTILKIIKFIWTILTITSKIIFRVLCAPFKFVWRILHVIRNFLYKHRNIFIPVGIISLCLIVGFLFYLFKKSPEKKETKIPAPLVTAEKLEKRDIQMTVMGVGTARAKVEVEIVPQVSGTIVSLNEQFKAGGFIPAGEEILKVDPRDYELSVEQAQAIVADARVKLDLEKAEAAVAIDEWKQLHPGTEPDSPLVLREPQIEQAKALLDSAKAGLATAKLNLERTSINLPIDVRIMRQNVDLGQFVSTGQAAGRAYGINAVEIEIPLEDKELAWIDIPDDRHSFNGNSVAKGKGSKVQVKAKFAGRSHIWDGYIIRTTGQIDEMSRLISIVVEVPEPYSAKVALLPGLFVEVHIDGNTIKDAIAIPRDAIHQSDDVITAWIVNDNSLHIKQLDIIRADKNFAYIKEGLNDGDMIITSSLDIAIDGMKVRVKQVKEDPNDN